MTGLIEKIAEAIARDCLERASADEAQKADFQDQFATLYMPHARAALSVIKDEYEMVPKACWTPAKKETQISAKALQELLDYNPQNGDLRWKSRTSATEYNARSRKIFNTRYAGKLALMHIGNTGYKVGRIKGIAFQAHRVAWAIHHGKWPGGQIDHINGDKTDNKIENLRVVTNAENTRNSPIRSNNSSGIQGVSWVSRDKKWRAVITHEGKKFPLGHYDDKHTAAVAYSAAARVIGCGPNHGCVPVSKPRKRKSALALLNLEVE